MENQTKDHKEAEDLNTLNQKELTGIEKNAVAKNNVIFKCTWSIIQDVMP